MSSDESRQKAESKYPNPYHRPESKPKFANTESVRRACVEAFTIWMSTHGVAGSYANIEAEEEGGDLDVERVLKFYFSDVERLLQEKLFQVATAVRVIDDQLRDVAPNAVEKFHEEGPAEYAAAFFTAGDQNKLSIRECCNKIIHARELKAVYDNGSSPSEDGGWYMTGEIEISGTIGTSEWNIILFTPVFLEYAVAYCDVFDESNSGAADRG